MPDVVGLPFHVGRDVATDARVALANPDPDGPPIASIAWPGAFVIVRQHPAAGALVHEWDSVAIEVQRDDAGADPTPARSPAAPRPTAPLIADAREDADG